jgi:hypothetical protein
MIHKGSTNMFQFTEYARPLSDPDSLLLTSS